MTTLQVQGTIQGLSGGGKVAAHGKASEPRSRRGARRPHRSATDVKAELYFGFADRDPSMTVEQIATFERALQKAGARYRSEVYEGARHGYTMADGRAYDEAARERHFRELCALLERARVTES